MAKKTTQLTQKLFADLQPTDEVIANDYAADGVTVVGTVRVPVADLLRKGITILDAPLATVNTANTVSATGPILGQTTDDQLVVKYTQTAGTDGWVTPFATSAGLTALEARATTLEVDTAAEAATRAAADAALDTRTATLESTTATNSANIASFNGKDTTQDSRLDAIEASNAGNLDASKYQGEWNPATNSPTLPVAGTAGNHYYIPTGAASTSANYVGTLADGDYLIDDGAAWLVRSANPAVVAARSITRSSQLAVAEETTLDQADTTKTLFDAMMQNTAEVGEGTRITGTFGSQDKSYVLVNDPASELGYLSQFKAYFGSTGDIKVMVVSKSGSDYTLLRSELIAVGSTGDQTLTLSTPLLMESGTYVAFYFDTGEARPTYVSGTNNYVVFSGELTGTETFSAGAGVTFQVAYTFQSYSAATKKSQFDALGTTQSNATAAVADLETAYPTTTTAYGVQSGVTGTFASQDRTFILKPPATAAGSLTKIKAYWETTGTVTVKVLSKSGLDFTVEEEANLTIGSTGLVETTLPTALDIAAGEYVGLYIDTAQARFSYISGINNYWSVAGEVTTTSTVTLGGAVELQFGFTVSARTVFTIPPSVANLSTDSVRDTARDAVNGRANYFSSTDFLGGMPPTDWAIGADWTSAAGGLQSATDNAGTLAKSDLAYFEKITQLDQTRMQVRLTLANTSSQICLIRYPRDDASGTYSDARGTLAMVDFTNSQLRLAQYNAETSTGGLTFDDQAFGFSPVTGREYLIELEKRGRQNVFRITDLTNVDNTVEHTDTPAESPYTVGDFDTGSSMQHGVFALGYLTGNVLITKCDLLCDYTATRLLVVGDSVSESSRVTLANGFPALIAADLGGYVAVSAQGGSKSIDALSRLEMELAAVRPEFVLLMCQYNDRQADGFLMTNLTSLVALVESYGATAIVPTMAPIRAAAQYTSTYEDPDTINPLILAEGWISPRLDRCLTTGNTGAVADRDTGKISSDDVHPNTSGHSSIYKQLKAEVPQIWA